MDWKDQLEPDTQKKSEVRKEKEQKFNLSKLSQESKDPEFIKLEEEFQDKYWEGEGEGLKKNRFLCSSKC